MIITNKCDACFLTHEKDKSCCTFCSQEITPPYLWWNHNIFICMDCCVKNKNGLISDLIHINAIIEIGLFYPTDTLTREDIQKVEKRSRLMRGED